MRELAWLGERSSLDVVVPGPGSVEQQLGRRANVIHGDYEALTAPSRRIRGLIGDVRRLGREVGEFRRLFRERRPQLVVVVTSMLPAASIAASLERIPSLVYCGELFDRGFDAGPIRSFARSRLAAFTGRLANAIIACSDAVARQFDDTRGTPVETIYPPVSGRWGEGDGGAFRARHGIAPEARVIASIGYLTEGRGQDLLIRAMPGVLAEHPDALCAIVGTPFPRPQDRAYRQHLVGLIAQLKLQDRVLLTGYVDDAADVYAAADVIVNPARVNEAFGRVPFEAAVAGLPSVVTDVGAVTELLRDRRVGAGHRPRGPGGDRRGDRRAARRPRARRQPGRRRSRGDRGRAAPRDQPGRLSSARWS